MYVCLCNGHRSSDVRRGAAESGSRCPREVYARLGKPPRCGRCLEFAAKLIDEVHEALGPPPESAPEGL